MIVISLASLLVLPFSLNGRAVSLMVWEELLVHSPVCFLLFQQFHSSTQKAHMTLSSVELLKIKCSKHTVLIRDEKTTKVQVFCEISFMPYLVFLCRARCGGVKLLLLQVP